QLPHRRAKRTLDDRAVIATSPRGGCRCLGQRRRRLGQRLRDGGCRRAAIGRGCEVVIGLGRGQVLAGFEYHSCLIVTEYALRGEERPRTCVAGFPFLPSGPARRQEVHPWANT